METGAQQWLVLDHEAPLAPEAAAELALADRAYQEPFRAPAHLRRALAIAPEHIEVSLALYRFYFYTGDLGQALPWAERCIERTARELGLPPAWQDVAAGRRDFSDFDAVKPRFFFLRLRRGVICRCGLEM